ncbi:MAG TPA: hypothetical protein VLY24_16100 [Bryobacteraceae bacterium]|nr:hypothetical protein [Bryobacteraceae bacterium]
MTRLSATLILLWFATQGTPVFSQFAGSVNSAPGVDLSGSWSPFPHEESVGNPALVEYYGVPIADGARTFALAWDASRLTLPEHQCQVHVVSYIFGGPLNLRIWEEKDPQSQRVIAIRQYISTYEQNRTIWMDGRPHPSPNAPHTWMGFSTGKWEGNTLTVYTTHIKQGELRRNGVPESDQATVTEHFMRYGDYLTHVSIVTDPVYLTEPFIRTQVFRLVVPEGLNWLYPCDSVEEIANRSPETVPNYLPGQNPFLREFAAKHHLPLDAVLGGAETMYPEFQLKMQQLTSPAAAPKRD